MVFYRLFHLLEGDGIFSAGFIIVANADGNISGITVTVATATATLEGYAFA